MAKGSRGVRVGERLPQYRGRKNTVLVLYRGAWCPVCAAQLVHLRDHYGEFEALGARIVAVSTDNPTVARIYRSTFGFPFELVSDPGRKLATRLGALEGEGALNRLDRAAHGAVGLKDYNQPAIAVMDRTGTVRYLKVGKDPLDRPGTGQILEVLKSLGRPDLGSPKKRPGKPRKKK